MPITPPDPPGLLDGTVPLDVIADDLQVTREVVKGMAQRGELPAFKVGRQWRVGLLAYAQWKADRAKTATRRRQRYTQGI